MVKRLVGAAFWMVVFGLGASAQTAEEFEAQLGYQTGVVTLSGGVATVNVPESFRFIGAEGSQRLLVDGWGNPPEAAEGVLGMLVPADVSPLTDEGWGVIINYEEDGYVNDDDAATIDYAVLLEQMQEATLAGNEERESLGFEPVTLIGWAETPRYDADEHKLYWAKELKFGNTEAHTLNYSIRILGRRGILVLNAVASMTQLEQVRKPTKELLSAVDFNDGHRYTDFISGDKVASYGVTALIAGGAGALAAKTGLLAKFWKAIVLVALKFWKLGLIAFVAAAGLLKKFFGSKAEAGSPSQG